MLCDINPIKFTYTHATRSHSIRNFQFIRKCWLCYRCKWCSAQRHWKWMIAFRVYIEWFVVMLVIRLVQTSMHVNCLLRVRGTLRYKAQYMLCSCVCMGLASSSSSSKKKCHKHKAPPTTFHDIFEAGIHWQTDRMRVYVVSAKWDEQSEPKRRRKKTCGILFQEEQRMIVWQKGHRDERPDENSRKIECL